MAWDSDNFFGGMFDFDGDGKMDAIEEGAAYMILDEWEKDWEKKERRDSDDDDDWT